jgi:prophage regulatory protein
MSDDDRFLRLAEVRVRVPVSKSTIYLWISRGEFPAPRELGGHAVGWLQSEVIAWMKARAAQPIGQQ